MLDFLGFIATLALMVFVVNALITFMNISRSAKLTLTAVAGLWIGLAGAAASAGWIAIANPFPVIGIFVALPLVAAAIATAWPDARQAMLSVPMPLLIGLNIGRVFAVLFLLLALDGRLAGPFPYFAGWVTLSPACLPFRCSCSRNPHRVETALPSLRGICSAPVISCWRSPSE